jgi:hypothetical protein
MAMLRRIPHPSPAMVVAMLALLVALSGTAFAAGVVPVATRALNADNAKKLQGRTTSQLVALASAKSQLADDASHLQGKSVDEIVTAAQTKSISAFVTIKQGNFSMGTGQIVDYTMSCDAGQKAISGGSQFSQAPAGIIESRPTADGSAWKVMLANPSDSDGAFGNLFVVCVS